MASPLDITPSNDGNVIRIPFPPLTEERRKELVKLAHKMGEEAKVAVRNIRRHAVDEIKAGQKGGDIPEDDAHRLTDEIQKLTDSFCDQVDEAFKSKENEIMEVRSVEGIPVYSLTPDPEARKLIDEFISACEDRHFRVKVIYHIVRGMR